MTLQEANQIIFQFMDIRPWSGQYNHDGSNRFSNTIYILNGKKFSGNFYEDLGAFTPVWEKLGLNANLSYQPKTKTYRCRVWSYSKSDLYKEKTPPKKYKKPEEAATIATAEAILKFKKREQ